MLLCNSSALFVAIEYYCFAYFEFYAWHCSNDRFTCDRKTVKFGKNMSPTFKV